MTQQTESHPERQIELTRTYDAPRTLVWKAFTEVEHLTHWWGPQGFTITTQHRDLTPGGTWRYLMHGPDGHIYPNLTTYLEVLPPEHLSYTHGSDPDASPKPVHNIQFHVTVTFESLSPTQTKLTMTSTFPSQAERDFVVRNFNAIEGGKQTLGRLAEHLTTLSAPPAPAPFVITRVFPTTPERMWDLWTKPEHLQQWFGPKETTISHATLDLTPGGLFHYAMRSPDGNTMWGKWTFRHLSPPHRLEFLASFSDQNAQTLRAPFSPTWPLEMLSVITFSPHAGLGRGTVVTITASPHHPTPAEQNTFNAALPSLTQGWTGTLDRLTQSLTP